MAFEKGFELGQYTQREVAKVRVFLGANAQIATATPLFSMGYSNTVTSEKTADRVYAMRAGQRGASFDGGKTTTLTIETQYYTMQHFAQMAGQSIKEGAQDIFRVDNVEVQAGGVIRLSKAPVNDDVAILPYVNGMVKRRPQTASSVNGRDVTIDLSGEFAVEVGDRVEVYYQYNVPQAYTLDFVDDKNPPIVTVVLDILQTDAVSGVVVPAQIIYYSAQLRQDSTMGFSSEGDPTSISLVYDVYVYEIDGENRTERMITYYETDGEYNWIDVKYRDQLEDEE